METNNMEYMGLKSMRVNSLEYMGLEQMGIKGLELMGSVMGPTLGASIKKMGLAMGRARRCYF